jgi:indole-3-glycerol phosphate synthase
MEGILKKILERIMEEEGPRFNEFDPSSFRLERRKPPIDVAALCARSFLVIAEVKKGSPSRGVIREDFDPVAIARAYEEGGASAVSVITEKNYFFGDKNNLRLIKQAVRLPVLRKDFIIHDSQVYDSYNLGADFILLIASCLRGGQLRDLCRTAESLGMGALVEIHDEEDLSKALKARPKLIGINNRDLRTFAVDWTASLRLRPLIPPGIHVISESGIHSHEQVRLLQNKGFSGVLVGEYLMKHDDPRGALRDLIFGRSEEWDRCASDNGKASAAGRFSGPGHRTDDENLVGRREKPAGRGMDPDFRRPRGKSTREIRVKICGLTNREDLRLAKELGADYAGFVFYSKSPRRVDPARVKEMIREMKAGSGAHPAFVGVFVNESLSRVRRIFGECGLDIVQLHGDETPEYCLKLGLPYWKAVRLKDESSLLELDRFPGSTLVLDSFTEGHYGGSGRTLSLDLAKKALDRGCRAIAAGGISVENLREILALNPLAVDVCSSLEEEPGKKSEEKMRAFFQKIHELRIPS